MFHKTTVIQMLSELPRVISASFCLVIVVWHSGCYFRRFGWDVGKKAFLLRYSALLKSRPAGTDA